MASFLSSENDCHNPPVTPPHRRSSEQVFSNGKPTSEKHLVPGVGRIVRLLITTRVRLDYERHRRARPGGALIAGYEPPPHTPRHRRARPGGALIDSYEGLPQGSDGCKLMERLQTAQAKRCPIPCTRPPTAAEPDGVRILEHRFSDPSVSQFFLRAHSKTTSADSRLSLRESSVLTALLSRSERRLSAACRGYC